MKNRVQLFRKETPTQTDLASRVGVNRACVDALEKGRFLPSIALAYNIAAALEIYVYEVPTPWPNSAPVAAIVQGQPSAPSRNLA